MAGVKGRSGGARPNSGGVRPGAGRKKKEPSPPVKQDDGKDMLRLLQDVALGKTDATALQVRAAIAAVQYTHTKRHDGGKKDDAADKAKQAAAGRFAAGAAPQLVVNNR
jgi:hypothetical protein